MTGKRTAVVVLDAATVALALLLAAVVSTGGFVLQTGDLQIRLRTPDRTLLWLSVAVILRLILDRRSLPFGIARSAWARHLTEPIRRPATTELVLVVCLFCIPLFVGLRVSDLENDEAIYSYTVDRVIETGDWLTPRSIPSDGAFLEKPPLKTWLVAGAIHAGLLPHDELGLRFFDALFGAVAFLYVLRLGQALAGPGCGFAACLVLFTVDALLFEHGLRANTMDAALVLAYCGGIYHFARWADGPPSGRRAAHAMAVAGYVALGFMTKFVAVFFLPLVCGLAFVWRPGGFRRLGSEWRQWVLPAVAVLAIAAPWFVYQMVAGGATVWREMFGIHVYQRFTAALDPNHLKPWYFYYVWTWDELVFAGSRWIAAAGLFWLAVRAWSGRPWLARLLFLWWLVPHVALSITTSKVFHYVYPFLPPLALGAGWVAVAVYRALDRGERAFAPPGASPLPPAEARSPAVAPLVGVVRARGVRRAAAIAVLALLLPVQTYPLQVAHLSVRRAPLQVLSECAASVPGLHGTRVYVPYFEGLANHAFYYYLRRVGPWMQSDSLDEGDLEERLFDPAHQTLALIAAVDYPRLADRFAFMPSHVVFPEGVVALTPGRFAVCGEAAVAAGGTRMGGEMQPPRGRHWH